MPVDTTPGRIILHRRFDILTDFTPEWFRTYLHLLAQQSSDPSDATCEVVTSPDSDERVTFHNVPAWAEYVLSHWTGIFETSLWPRNSWVKMARCDHRRGHLTLRVEGVDTADAQRNVDRLSAGLSLGVSPPLPYRYRRAALEFEIGHWRPDIFVTGVQRIAEQLGGQPDISDASAKSYEGDIEKLTPFFDLPTFIEIVGKPADRFEEIAVRMQRLGVGVGIYVTPDHKTLRILTTLLTDDIDRLVEAWPPALKLKQVKAKGTGTDVTTHAAAAPVESPWLKYAVPALIALVTAASVAGAVTLKKAIWPDYDVVVLSPATDHGIAVWRGESVPLDWYLRAEQPAFRSVLKGVPATIRVRSSSRAPQVLKAAPPVSLSLPPGTYLVTVDAPDATPLPFQLKVLPAGTGDF